MEVLIIICMILSFILSIQFLALSIKNLLQEKGVGYIFTSFATLLYLFWFLNFLRIYLKF